MIRSTRVLLTAFVVLAGLALVPRAGARLAAQSGVVASDPWMRMPMGNAAQTAVFVVLENKTGEKRHLVSATSSISDKVELHTMSNENGMMRMSPVKAVDVPANGKAELKPGSFHIMLFDLKQHPADGATVDLTLTFDNGQTLPIKATVRKPEGMR
ncbi:MAG: copper chaperone PCu(A)C [Vicinamibacterales bacterium]